MNETIGKVTLDYTFYPGEDLYSDGAVEDELLSIAKEYDESQWNQVIAERKSWPILYHYSHIRRNIVSWLPIGKEERVLEIGSGCGAITGALADQAKSVTCVELSRKRSHINAYRHQKKDNIEILVGNFQDIEKTLGTYDVITLIGVFEYSNGYIGGEQPFADMLRTIRKHLAPGGRLVIAIENRLGLKYWAGCTEDHTGTWFEGLEDYPKTKSVHTFSHKEMLELIRSVGGLKAEMYYPYPDYKFPMQIFSDERLPQQGELKELRYNFDRERMILFDEIRVADSLIRNDLFPVYSNSFLLILTAEETELPEEHCIFAKYSNERGEYFSTRTEIWKLASGEREVRKIAESAQSIGFVDGIYEHYKGLTGLYGDQGVRMNHCEKCSGGVAFEYVEGRTLEEELDQLLAAGRTGQIRELLQSVAGILRAAATEPFRMTDSFREVFGEAAFSKEMLCPVVCNIDPVCSNLIRREDGWEMLDYEWSFDFPIPTEFQIFRLLHYYLYTSTARQSLQEAGLFEEAGISEEDIAVFEEMERHFQQYIQTGRVPMRKMYDDISPGVFFDTKSIAEIRRKQNTRKLQVYLDLGQDFSEENSYHLNTEGGVFDGVIDLNGDIRRLRIDPCEEHCIVELKEFCLTDGEKELPVPVTCTGRYMRENTYYFADADPYFIIDIPEGQKQLKLSARIYYLGTEGGHPAGLLLDEQEQLRACLAQTKEAKAAEEESRRKLSREEQVLKAENTELKNQIAYLQEKIRQMENTKVWKAYTRIKGNK